MQYASEVVYRLYIENEQGTVVQTNLCESLARAKAQANIHANTILTWEEHGSSVPTWLSSHYGFYYVIEGDV